LNDGASGPWANAIAIGTQAVSHADGVACGYKAIEYRGIAIGGFIVDDGALGVGAIAIGGFAKGQPAIAVGSQANAPNALAVGDSATAINYGTAVGRGANAVDESVAFGANTKASEPFSTGFGYWTLVAAGATQSVSLGAYAVATRPNVVSLGHTAKDFPLLNVQNVPAEQFRSIACVAKGAFQHDAINGEQYNALAVAVNNLLAHAGDGTIAPLPILPLEPAP
jgi:hypothetical protein